MNTAFHNKDGSLTAYAYACGYVSRTEEGEKGAELYMEHSHYQVRFFDRSKPDPSDPTLFYREWESFRRLSDARKRYAEFRKKVAA